MDAKKTKFSVRSVVARQSEGKKAVANPINLEAMVNSGRVRMAGNDLKKVSDKSIFRKTK